MWHRFTRDTPLPPTASSGHSDDGAVTAHFVEAASAVHSKGSHVGFDTLQIDFSQSPAVVCQFDQAFRGELGQADSSRQWIADEEPPEFGTTGRPVNAIERDLADRPIHR